MNLNEFIDGKVKEAAARWMTEDISRMGDRMRNLSRSNTVNQRGAERLTKTVDKARSLESSKSDIINHRQNVHGSPTITPENYKSRRAIGRERADIRGDKYTTNVDEFVNKDSIVPASYNSNIGYDKRHTPETNAKYQDMRQEANKRDIKTQQKRKTHPELFARPNSYQYAPVQDFSF